MGFNYKEEVIEKSYFGDCYDNDNDKCFEQKDEDRYDEYDCNKCQDDFEKEYLGKSVAECKYFRVCTKRFFEPEKKRCPKHHDRCCNKQRHCECRK